MGPIPIRAILSFATLVGVVTAGAVLVLGAPPTHAERSRQASEQATRSRGMVREIRDAMEQGRLRDAEAISARHTDTFPEEPTAWLYYALVRQRLGDQTQARQGWDRLLELTGPRPGRFGMGTEQMFMQAWAHYGAGRKGDAFRLWWQTANSTRGRAVSGQSFYELAHVMAELGEHEDAIRALHLAIDGGFQQLVVLRVDETMDPLRSMPGYQRAVDRMVRRSMGPEPSHGPNHTNNGETRQILSLEPPFEERLQRWIEQWGDL